MSHCALRGWPYYYQNSQPDIGDRLPFGVYESFDNRGGNVGIPLPAGVVRIYKDDSHGLAQFAGVRSRRPYAGERDGALATGNLVRRDDS